MRAQNGCVDRTFCLRWMLANAVGQTVGVPLGCVVAFVAARAIFSVGEVAGFVMVASVFGAVVGTTVGIMQWIVLEQKRCRINGWIMASAAGGALGWGVVMVFLLSLFTASYGWD